MLDQHTSQTWAQPDFEGTSPLNYYFVAVAAPSVELLAFRATGWRLRKTKLRFSVAQRSKANTIGASVPSAAAANAVVDATLEGNDDGSLALASLPCHQEPWWGIGQAMLEGGQPAVTADCESSPVVASSSRNAASWRFHGIAAGVNSYGWEASALLVIDLSRDVLKRSIRR